MNKKSKITQLGKVLNITLLTLATCTLGATEIYQITKPTYTKPIGYNDFTSLDKLGKTISCSQMTEQLSSDNIGVDEKALGYSLKQCQFEIKQNIEKHCDLYVKDIEKALIDDNQPIDYNKGTKDVCQNQLDKSFSTYNDSFEMSRKNNMNAIFVPKYHSKTPTLTVLINKKSIILKPTDFDQNLWQVSYNYSFGQNANHTYQLIFSDKEKAETLYAYLNNK